MLPDRADTTATIEAAVTRATEYWGGPHDQEFVILAELQQQGIVIKRADLADMVEARIAIDWADQHADLTRYGLSDEADWFTRAEFIQQQRTEWLQPALARVVRRTWEQQQATRADQLQAA